MKRATSYYAVRRKGLRCFNRLVSKTSHHTWFFIFQLTFVAYGGFGLDHVYYGNPLLSGVGVVVGHIWVCTKFRLYTWTEIKCSSGVAFPQSSGKRRRLKFFVPAAFKRNPEKFSNCTCVAQTLHNGLLKMYEVGIPFRCCGWFGV